MLLCVRICVCVCVCVRARTVTEIKNTNQYNSLLAVRMTLTLLMPLTLVTLTLLTLLTHLRLLTLTLLTLLTLTPYAPYAPYAYAPYAPYARYAYTPYAPYDTLRSVTLWVVTLRVVTVVTVRYGSLRLVTLWVVTLRYGPLRYARYGSLRYGRYGPLRYGSLRSLRSVTGRYGPLRYGSLRYVTVVTLPTRCSLDPDAALPYKSCVVAAVHLISGKAYLMGLTNAERQRRWRVKHKAKSFHHLEQLQQPARNRQGDYRGWPLDMSGDEASQSGADDSATSTYDEAPETDHQHEATRDIASNVYQVPHLACDERRAPQWLCERSKRDYDEDVGKLSASRSPQKREKDALRYLALCVDHPITFRHTIDALPDSSIRRICDAVLNATEGDARLRLTSEQRRLCDKYKRSTAFLTSPTNTLKRKRDLLLSAKKQVGGSVFVPLMLSAALDTFGRGLIPTKR
jgi:hypothetical protein